MIEQKALAYVNMYGVLGSLEKLCEIDETAIKELKKLKKPVALCFDVSDGPCCTFTFSENGCKMTEGSVGCTAKMNFGSPEKFNELIDNSKPGLPAKNPVGTIAFLLGTFTKLTNRLNELLRPTEDALKDRAFFEENTLMTMYVIGGAVAALANNDSIAKISASYTPDGDVQMNIPERATITVRVKDGKFTAIKGATANPRAVMEFADIDLAYGLFNGKVSTINEMCKGNIRLSGMISMIDNINRILDRVSVYLA